MGFKRKKEFIASIQDVAIKKITKGAFKSLLKVAP